MRRILAINVLALAIPVLGLLHLEEYRETLIGSELEALKLQSRAFALSFGSSAVESYETGEDILRAAAAQRLMRVLLSDTGVRARLFNRSGALLADSYVLTGSGAQVEVMELPPMNTPWWGGLGRIYDAAIAWLPGQTDLPIYFEASHQQAGDYWEAEAALEGESPTVVRREKDGSLVLSVAVPVQRYRQILAALMLSKGGADIAQAVEARRRDILIIFGVALAVTVLLSIYLARAIARPLHRLALAADQVSHGQDRAQEIPDLRGRGDEIGDLSAALRDMTQALHDRLDAIEGFAADVSHEIKNPLTSLRSAVETVARIEDPDQQRRLMSIILDDVGRLDRLITDISDASRLDAELSREEMEPVDIAALLRTMAELHGLGALAAGEAPDGSNEGPYDGPLFELDLDATADLTVQGLEDRLGQVLRNVISNAVTFSPAGGRILLAAELIPERDREMVKLRVDDQGPGLPPAKLDAVFDRFYSERPRGEKFGTHSGLGLSISRQIIEAHGGRIWAENRHDDGGEIAGARFVIELPAG